MKKPEFLSILSSERARLERLIEAVGPARMETPGVSGTYSTKNLLAHLMAYEEALVKWLVQAKAGRVYVDGVLDQPDLDARNAAVYQAHRQRSPGDVVSTFKSTFDELQECVSDLSEQELNDTEMTAWFVVPRWQRKQELWKCIANDSYEHHQQHIPDIESWLKENGEAA